MVGRVERSVRAFEAERQFRRIIGYRDLAKLAVAIECELGPTAEPTPTAKEAVTLVTV